MFDIIVLAVVGLSILFGFWKGMIRQVVGLAGVVAGYMVAMHFYGSVAARFLRGFTPAIGHIIAFLGIFVVCIIVASLAGWLVGKLMSIAGLGVLNRIGGALLGAAKGCFIVAVAVMMLIVFLPSDNGLLKGPRTVKYVLPMTGVLSTFAPKAIKARYDQKMTRMGGLSGRRK